MNENTRKALRIAKQIEAVSWLLRVAAETGQTNDSNIDVISELLEEKAAEQSSLLSDGEDE